MTCLHSCKNEVRIKVFYTIKNFQQFDIDLCYMNLHTQSLATKVHTKNTNVQLVDTDDIMYSMI